MSGTQAIAELRRLATGAGLLVAPDELERQARRVAAATARADTDSRRQRLAELHAEFLRLHGQENRQARGYAFENLLTDLFHLEELEYNGSYKTELDQVDGALNFKAFTYLIEARWRQAPAVEADLVLLKGKVDRRVFATRGLFISMAGFRPEVVQFYRLAHENKLILMDAKTSRGSLTAGATWRTPLQRRSPTPPSIEGPICSYPLSKLSARPRAVAGEPPGGRCQAHHVRQRVVVLHRQSTTNRNALYVESRNDLPVISMRPDIPRR